jgi:hypothetical protein
MLGKIERATRAAKRDTATELDLFFRTDGALLRKWESAALASSDSPEWFRQVTRSEERATEIRTWAPILVPGFLQVDGYARSVFRAGRPLDTPKDVERLVAARMGRFRVLLRDDGPAHWVVLCESVLRRAMGGTETMRKQLEVLANLAESQRVRVQIVPHDLPDHPGASGPFRLLHTQDGETVVYGDSTGGGQIFDSPAEVRRHVCLFGDLQAVAWSPTSSLQAIRRAHDEL